MKPPPRGRYHSTYVFSWLVKLISDNTLDVRFVSLAMYWRLGTRTGKVKATVVMVAAEHKTARKM